MLGSMTNDVLSNAPEEPRAPAIFSHPGTFSSCRRSCRQTHALPNTASCFGEHKVCGDFGGKFVGRKKRHGACGSASFRAGPSSDSRDERTCRAFSDHPLPTTREGGRKTLHASVQAIPGPARRGEGRSGGADRMLWSGGELDTETETVGLQRMDVGADSSAVGC